MRLQADLEPGGAREHRGGLPVQSLGEVPPRVRPGRVVLGDLPVDLQLLHHVPADGAVSLTWLAEHLGLPKSTASTVVKSLGQRGFVARARDPQDERRLAIALTEQGLARLAEDTVLDPAGLRAALATLPPAVRDGLLDGLERLADAAESGTGQARGHHG